MDLTTNTLEQRLRPHGSSCTKSAVAFRKSSVTFSRSVRPWNLSKSVCAAVAPEKCSAIARSTRSPVFRLFSLRRLGASFDAAPKRVSLPTFGAFGAIAHESFGRNSFSREDSVRARAHDRTETAPSSVHERAMA